MSECATEEKTSDFRRRTSARLGARRLRRPRGACIVASRGLELEVTIRGSGTPAASALARHCEATGVSLPRGWRAADDETNGTCGTNGTVGSARGLPPASFPAKSNGMLVAFMRVLESADGAGIHCADPAQEAQVALAALQAFAQWKARNGMNALSYTAEHIHKGLLLCEKKKDIVTGIPDYVNGRFAELGWAHSFITKGEISVSVSWEKGKHVDGSDFASKPSIGGYNPRVRQADFLKLNRFRKKKGK